MNLKRSMMIVISIASFSVWSAPKKLWVTIGTDVKKEMGSHKGASKNVKFYQSQNNVSVAEVDVEGLGEISHVMHDSFHRCGGFIVHDSKEAAEKHLNELPQINSLASNVIFNNYSIDQSDKVNKMITHVDEFSIRSMIEKLSSFHTRYYTSDDGVKSQKWLLNHWKEIAGARSDISVDFFNHKNWPQPSVILTVQGTSNKDEVIVIGGHADSIAANWLGMGSKTARSPGADDNASGISTITEALKALVKSNYQPKRTIKFMAYAAEEVGLKGSKEIAKSYKKEGINVIGKIQFDMTNFNGTGSQDIVMMSDFTNKAQNEFVGKLIDQYVQAPWGYDKCGYGCSDHASWHSQGFPATMPFEARFKDMNSKIHTKNDTIEQSNGTADHAVKFAKLAISYMVEMGK